MQTKYKFLILFSIISIAIGYSFYTKNKIDNYFSQPEASAQTSILKGLPSFQVFDLKGNTVNSDSFKTNSKGYYIHIWGTWCGPCEVEFGDLLGFASKLENRNVIFYLIAVNDEVVKIEKFLKRYKTIPNNVRVLIDQNNQVMDKFGTFKVPETFLFSPNNEALNKYVGPQEWLQEIYTTQAVQHLSL